jgi:hypothetical protein
MNILKRNYTHRNLIAFLFLSLIYLEAIGSLAIGDSLFSLARLKDFFTNHYFVFAATLFSIYTAVKFKKYSQWVLLSTVVLIAGENFILLSGSFNKLILVLNFIYVIFAFYYYIVWELEVELACFNPKYTRYDLVKEDRFPLKALIVTDNEEAKKFSVHLTNIDDQSCFVLLEPHEKEEVSVKNNYQLLLNFDGVEFTTKASIVSRYDRGYGFMFEKRKSELGRPSWSDLYYVCLERGIVT